MLVSNKSHSRDEARELAKKYLDQARENPALFDDLVKKHSEDPSVIANKGRFTGVGPGDMVEQFEKASFALEEIGSFSPLVETPYGFHIIRLDGVEPPRQLSFEETREQLSEQANQADLE